MRQAMFALGTVGLGLSSAPLFAYATMISPTILPSAIGLTMAIFGGASLAAYQMPKDKMLSYGRPLAGCLIGLIGLQLVGLLSTFLIGPNLFSTLLFRADAYVAIALFTAFVAYDTHVAIRNYE